MIGGRGWEVGGGGGGGKWVVAWGRVGRGAGSESRVGAGIELPATGEV